jgi:hypothetical protein
MATTKTTIAFNGPNCGVTEAVTSFEAAAYAFLEAFNSASQHTRTSSSTSSLPPQTCTG